MDREKVAFFEARFGALDEDSLTEAVGGADSLVEEASVALEAVLKRRATEGTARMRIASRASFQSDSRPVWRESRFAKRATMTFSSRCGRGGAKRPFATAETNPGVPAERKVLPM